MRIRSMQAGPIMQLPVFLILFFAPVYVPLALLEGWLHAVAEVNPVTRLLETGREFVAGEPANAAAAFGDGGGACCALRPVGDAGPAPGRSRRSVTISRF